MASIEKRGEYTYRITVSNGYRRDGKKVTEKRTVTLDASFTHWFLCSDITYVADTPTQGTDTPQAGNEARYDFMEWAPGNG